MCPHGNLNVITQRRSRLKLDHRSGQGWENGGSRGTCYHLQGTSTLKTGLAHAPPYERNETPWYPGRRPILETRIKQQTLKLRVVSLCSKYFTMARHCETLPRTTPPIPQTTLAFEGFLPVCCRIAFVFQDFPSSA